MIAEELPDDWHNLELYLPARYILSSTSSAPLSSPLNHRMSDAQPRPYPFSARVFASPNSEFSPNFPQVFVPNARSIRSTSSSPHPPFHLMSPLANASTPAPLPIADADAVALADSPAAAAVGPLQALLVAVLVLVIAGTAVGNFLVALSLLVVRRLRSQPANLLLLSLSVSDQLIALTVEPFALYKTVLAPNGWALGPFTCKVCPLCSYLYSCVHLNFTQSNYSRHRCT